MLIDLPLDIVEGDRLLYWGHWRCGRDFLRNYFRKVFESDILSIGTQLSMKAPVYGGDFSS